jgi:hypothetical protein
MSNATTDETRKIHSYGTAERVRPDGARIRLPGTGGEMSGPLVGVGRQVPTLAEFEAMLAARAVRS